MKKTLVLFIAMLFALFVVSCDSDECSVCHECDCICKTTPDTPENTNGLQSEYLCEFQKVLEGNYSSLSW